MKYLISVILALGMSAAALGQDSLEYSSGPSQVPLLELYTSEGCSSCPPADRWLSQLEESQSLWTAVVPIAFHVDYWNYLGWPDRFSRPEFAERQRLFRHQGYTSGVYTPGVIVNGDEWRQWGRSGWPHTSHDMAGVLRLELNENRFEANYDADEGASLANPRLHIAILGFGLKSDVKAGENRGEMLQHDFVVLGYRQFASSYTSWSGKLPKARNRDEAARLGLAAWVSNGNDLQPLQATGGWLPLQ